LAQALAILQERLSFRQEGRDFVFGSQGGSFQGWSAAKRGLDDRLGTPEPWRLHIRRTIATRMAEDLKVLPHVIEAVLNHVSGHKAGVVAPRIRQRGLEAQPFRLLRTVAQIREFIAYASSRRLRAAVFIDACRATEI
jgi:hypothetical protein